MLRNYLRIARRNLIRNRVLSTIIMASPIAWYAMNRWLQDFAYKIDIEWWVFALLTVSFQSIKAALMNPVKSLRSE